MIYLFLANGFEEIEAIAPLDILRRAELDVITVGVGGRGVVGSHKIPVFADAVDDEVFPDENCEGIILPGGLPGTLNLEKSVKVNEFIDYAVEHNLPIAAICAAPSILGHKGLLKGKEAICYDGFETQLEGAIISNKSVCRDGNIITAKGAGVALDFGFELVSVFKNKESSNKIKESMKCIQ